MLTWPWLLYRAHGANPAQVSAQEFSEYRPQRTHRTGGSCTLTDRRFTVKSEEALVRARALARDKSHTAVTTGHLLAALFEADYFVALYLRPPAQRTGHTQARVTSYLAQLPAATTCVSDAELVLDPELSAALEQAQWWVEELDDEVRLGREPVAGTGRR